MNQPDSTPVIRAAVSKDLPDIKQCTTLAYQKYIERIGRKPAPMLADFAQQIEAGTVSEAVVNSELAGYIVNYATPHYWHIENVAVLPMYSGNGIGRTLIHHAEDTARQTTRLPCVELYTNAAMNENLAIYPKLGYEVIERRIEDGFERVYFRKWLYCPKGPTT